MVVDPWVTIIINLVAAVPPTIAAVAAVLVARKSPAETTKKLDEVDKHVSEVRTTMINHVTDKSAHRGRRS
jgi:uncharacterized membrane-anchored protein YhcB (DUF1043 family)